jgi:hypothetical protein
MESYVEELTGAWRYERSGERATCRNGYRGSANAAGLSGSP